MDERTRVAVKLMAGLLDYPGHPTFWPRLAERRTTLFEVLPQLRDMVAEWEVLGPHRLSAVYVAAFDFGTGASLYVTEHEFADSRLRGKALSDLVALYQRAGYEPPEQEVPDYLPALLELMALASETVAAELGPRLSRVVARIAQHVAESHPYGPLLQALQGVLGPADARLPAGDAEADRENLPYPVQYE
jgi:nitrate reductase delta subunit